MPDMRHCCGQTDSEREGGWGEYIVNRMSEVPFGWNMSSPGFTVKNITVNRLS